MKSQAYIEPDDGFKEYKYVLRKTTNSTKTKKLMDEHECAPANSGEAGKSHIILTITERPYAATGA